MAASWCGGGKGRGERGWEEAREDRGESNGEHVITTGENYKGKVHSITSYCLLATEASG